jgi:hypothetical protein
MEKMFGQTPDMSMFRFHFWKPIWYFKPTAKYPNSNFLPGRFVCIAWEHGNAFTYRIWTTPDNDWKKGCKLIRNVVKSRSLTETEPRVDYNESSLVLAKTKVTRTQQRKATRSSKKKNRPREEPEDDDRNTKKRLVTFSDSLQVHNADPEETGADTGEQGITPT